MQRPRDRTSQPAQARAATHLFIRSSFHSLVSGVLCGVLRAFAKGGSTSLYKCAFELETRSRQPRYPTSREKRARCGHPLIRGQDRNRTGRFSADSPVDFLLRLMMNWFLKEGF